MGLFDRSENDMPQSKGNGNEFDPVEFAQSLAIAMDQIEPMMGMPVAVRDQFLKKGFSETAAEQAAMAMWMSMMGLGNKDAG